MSKFMSIIFTVAVLALPTVGAQSKNASNKLLRDGYALAGLDGKLVEPNGTGKWSFQFDEAVADDKGIIKPDQPVQILTCSALDKITGDSKSRTEKSYRIWGQLTNYRDKNYIFLNNFLPLSDITSAEMPPTPAEQSQPEVDEPNDTFTIPKEVVDILQARRTVSFAKPKEVPQLKEDDGILSDRTGFVIARPSQGVRVFELDALGRNVQQLTFRLLPCESLQRLESKQPRSLGPARFKVAGIITRYEGIDYLLLQRAELQYNHGNFAR